MSGHGEGLDAVLGGAGRFIYALYAMEAVPDSDGDHRAHIVGLWEAMLDAERTEAIRSLEWIAAHPDVDLHVIAPGLHHSDEDMRRFCGWAAEVGRSLGFQGET